MDSHPNASMDILGLLSDDSNQKLNLPTPAASPITLPLEEPASATSSMLLPLVSGVENTEPQPSNKESETEETKETVISNISENNPNVVSLENTHSNTEEEPAAVQQPLSNFDYSHVITDERDKRLFSLMNLDPNDFFRTMFGANELSLDRFLKTAPFMTTGHQSVVYYKLRDDSAISCVNWKGRCYITGTDIVRLLIYRFEEFTGKPPHNMKKFEEGIFSDLRRLSPPHDCILEGTRSDFLVFLFNMDCVRSKKKQKVFYWERFQSVAHNIFCDAVERELARLEMAKAVGMSVDEFIKSGVVPTGTSSQNDPGRFSLTFDWTVRCLPLTEENRIAILGIDQIHVIRNDIANLFGRFLRMQLIEPSRTCNEGEEAVAKQFQLRVSTGHFVPPKPEPPARDYDNDENDFELKPHRKQLAKRKVSPKNTPPMTPKSGIKNASGYKYGRYRGSATSSGFYRRDDDDNYSISTISSNEEEIRMLYRPPEPVPTFIEHGYDEEYYYYQSHGGTPFSLQPHPNDPYSNSPRLKYTSQIQPTGTTSPYAMTSRQPFQTTSHDNYQPSPKLTPPLLHQSLKRALEEETTPKLHESDAAKRLKALQDCDRDTVVNAIPAEQGAKGNNAYEAAYILLGISRS